jgi:regulator of cell morphogenesis and NO signaling
MVNAKGTDMQLVSLYANETVADIVKNNYRTARVFKAHGINYCCVGNVSLRDACDAKNVSYDELVQQLNEAALNADPGPELQFHEWKTDFLVDYIINVHHSYLRQAIPELEKDWTDFLNRHPGKYGSFKHAQPIFSGLSTAMQEELEEQENIIFPYIKQLYSAYRRREPYGKLLVQTLRKPVNKKNENATNLSERLDSIRNLLNNYRPAESTCTGYVILLKRLHDFDNHLVLHKHLENNILFPAVAQMEQELLTT